MKHRRQSSKQRGFTLIELLLYMAISSIIMTATVALLLLMLSAREQNQAVGEVEGQGAFVMQEIGESIRNAASITTPLPAAAANSLTLQETDTTKSPTVYALASGVVSVTEGNTKAIALNSNAISISNLSFQNLSLAGTTSQIIRVTFTVTYVNNTGRPELDYAKTFYNSYSLR